MEPQLVTDDEFGAAYLRLSREDVVITREVAAGVLIDMDEHGSVVGVEVLYAVG